jgi:hypothetical protein
LLQLNVYGAVPFEPVNVIFGDRAFWHIDVVPLIRAIGNGLTVTVALPAWVCKQLVLLASLTLTSA